MNHYDAILFDLDGTLVDTAPDFVIAGNALRADHALAPLPASQIAMQVSNGAAAVTSRCLDIDDSHPRFDEYREQLLAHYWNCLGAESLPYPSLPEFLALMQQQSVQWGVVTNKPVRYAEPLLAKLGLGESCNVLICPDHVRCKKPDPESLLLAADRLNVSAERTIYVGDHRRDIEAGQAAGMLTVAVSYGYLLPADSPSSWGADLLSTSSQALVEVLARLVNSGAAGTLAS